jgi:hypothetical protein
MTYDINAVDKIITDMGKPPLTDEEKQHLTRDNAETERMVAEAVTYCCHADYCHTASSPCNDSTQHVTHPGNVDCDGHYFP